MPSYHSSSWPGLLESSTHRGLAQLGSGREDHVPVGSLLFSFSGARCRVGCLMEAVPAARGISKGDDLSQPHAPVSATEGCFSWVVEPVLGVKYYLYSCHTLHHTGQPSVVGLLLKWYERGFPVPAPYQEKSKRTLII